MGVSLNIKPYSQEVEGIDRSAIRSVDWSNRSTEELTLELMKIAIMNPRLYNQLRDVLIPHLYPTKLSFTDQRIRQILINLAKGNNDEQTRPVRTIDE